MGHMVVRKFLFRILPVIQCLGSSIVHLGIDLVKVVDGAIDVFHC